MRPVLEFSNPKLYEARSMLDGAARQSNAVPIELIESAADANATGHDRDRNLSPCIVV